MQCLTWCAPILPGKLDAWRDVVAEVSATSQEYAALMARHGIAREVVSLVRGPAGYLACLFQEGEDIAASLRSFATSEHPYDVSIRDRLMDVHGFTTEMLTGSLPATVVLDMRASAPVGQEPAPVG